MKYGYKLTARSKKDYSTRTFGKVHPLEFPYEYSVRSPFPIPDQNAEGLFNGCTAYSVCGIAEAQDGIEYDDKKQYEAALKRAELPAGSPMSLNDAFDIPIHIGLWEKGKDVDPAVHKKPAYFFVEGDYDHFDNIRQTLMQNKDDKRACGVGHTWYDEFRRVGSDGILPDNPTLALGGHSVIIDGWKIINGQPYLTVESHQGPNYGDHGYVYYSRALTNKLFAQWGASAATIKDAPDGEIMKIQLNWIQQLIEKLIIIVKNLMAKQVIQPTKIEVKDEDTPVVVPIKTSRIREWAEAVAAVENVRPALNNPCALKLTTLTQEWGCEEGSGALDGGTLCYFSTREKGLQAGCNLLELGAQDKLKDYHDARTLRLFTREYANVKTDEYATAVAKRLGVDVDINISTFL